MLLFGVTGGIGTGKTTVCSFLKELGIHILEADPVARHLTITLPEIRHALTQTFGEHIYHEDGNLNKERMNKLVFSDPKTQKQINAIIHPPVLRWLQEEAARLFAEEKVMHVGVEAALIYESKMQRILDLVVVVDAPLESRIAWVQARNHLSRAEVIKRIEAQMPITEKIQMADYIIKNDGDQKKLRSEVDKFYSWLKTGDRNV